MLLYKFTRSQGIVNLAVIMNKYPFFAMDTWWLRNALFGIPAKDAFFTINKDGDEHTVTIETEGYCTVVATAHLPLQDAVALPTAKFYISPNMLSAMKDATRTGDEMTVLSIEGNSLVYHRGAYVWVVGYLASEYHKIA